MTIFQFKGREFLNCCIEGSFLYIFIGDFLLFSWQSISINRAVVTNRTPDDRDGVKIPINFL